MKKGAVQAHIWDQECPCPDGIGVAEGTVPMHAGELLAEVRVCVHDRAAWARLQEELVRKISTSSNGHLAGALKGGGDA